jgi:ankyrin repeat protein
LLLLLLRTTVKYEYCLTRSLLSRAASTRGRGIASHLHAVHTPWKAPSNAERKRRRLKADKQNRTTPSSVTTTTASPILLVEAAEIYPRETNLQGPWEPSPKEVDDWNAKVLLIVAELDGNPLALPMVAANKQQEPNPLHSSMAMQSLPTSAVGLDRNGNRAKSYKASLPPFLQAASDGNRQQLQHFLESFKDNPCQLWKELNRNDRHGSVAEHWAAGGGHLDCLKLLKETRQRHAHHEDVQPPSRIRRRDGKTALHYAARNGRIQCLEYLLQQGHVVDETSGDGTTAFHLACFGAHLDAIRCLLDHGADSSKANDWGCTAVHWIAMTKCDSTTAVWECCEFLQQLGVSFVTRQSQGHSTLHKAAQRLNKHVIEWMAREARLSYSEKQIVAKPDHGGYTPSDIWKSMGGEKSFGEWMKHEMGW